MTAAVRALLAPLYMAALILVALPPSMALALTLYPSWSWQGPVVAFTTGGVFGAAGALAEDRALGLTAEWIAAGFAAPTLPPSGGDNDGRTRPQPERIHP